VVEKRRIESFSLEDVQSVNQGKDIEIEEMIRNYKIQITKNEKP
jgi:hypothetical protein